MNDRFSLRDVVAAAIASAENTGAAPAGEVCLALVARLPIDGGVFTAMTSDASRERLYASDETIAEVADLEFALGEGPGLQVFSTGAPVLIPDLAAASGARWPVFAAAAAELALGGLFVFPMQVGAITVGVCEFYRRESAGLSVDELALVLTATELATLTVLHLHGGEALDYADGIWLDEAPDPVVHQATGMLMGQLGVPAGEAFARLRGYSFAHHRRMGEVAADIVNRRLRLDFEPD